MKTVEIQVHNNNKAHHRVCLLPAVFFYINARIETCRTTSTINTTVKVSNNHNQFTSSSRFTAVTLIPARTDNQHINNHNLCMAAMLIPVHMDNNTEVIHKEAAM